MTWCSFYSPENSLLLAVRRAGDERTPVAPKDRGAGRCFSQALGPLDRPGNSALHRIFPSRRFTIVESRRELCIQAENLSRFHAEVCSGGGHRCNWSLREERHRGVEVYLRAVECCSNGGCSEPLAIKDAGSSPPTTIAPRFPPLTRAVGRTCTRFPGESARDQPSRCGRSGGHSGEGRGRG